MHNKKWNDRPNEVINYFNPSYCCAILTSSVVGYKDINDNGMPFLISYLVFPLLMHKKTRDLLPRSSNTSFGAWVIEKPEIQFRLVDNIKSLRPFVSEALIFGCNQGWLFFENDFIDTNKTENQIKYLANNKCYPQVKKDIMRSRIVGKWLANAGTIETVFGILGVKP